MRIAELFYSIQGEGRLAGVPSFFIRTSGCNLRCVWCDTPYASWNPEGVDMDISDILARARATPARHVVLTGGEPMVARDVQNLAATLRDAGYHLTIETAGTIAPEGIACDLASISPKLVHSTPPPSSDGWDQRHENARLRPDILRQWAEAYPCQWKFVVRGAEDLPEIRELMATLSQSLREPIAPEAILLMPEGTNVETLRQRQKSVASLCLAEGYRLCPRLHIELYGNTRGT